MSSFDLSPDLAARLDALVPAEALTGDWADVVRRARPRPRRAMRRWVKVALALCLLLLLAVVATAAYVTFWRSSAPHPGALTVSDSESTQSARIVEVGPNGEPRVVWHCPRPRACGDLSSFDWSSDGRRLAFTLNEVPPFTSPQPRILGLHILDLATGRDFTMPQETEDRLGGCMSLEAVTWSPDARMLAFVCPQFPGEFIAVLRRDGSGVHRINTRLVDSSSPTWSPNGKRLAFAGIDRRSAPSSIYVTRLDGTHRVLVARNGSAPAWSPDGKTIAYSAPQGIRLVTPGGVDVTPNGHPIAANGTPAWSPDGATLAVATDGGVYLVAKTGAGLRFVTPLGYTTRPAWYPAKRAPAEQQQPDCGPC
ncbi:MAG TPA: hypothetical protein VFU10_05145 [Gaiellaceae bacterium]|nr:hypothetical protein [Gaiellaceae bacterium]